MPRACRLLFALICLTGCAERWVKPGASQAEFDAMQAGCTARGYARFPPLPQLVQTSPGVVMPMVTQCRQGRNGPVCYPVGGGYAPPSYVTVDSNLPGRSAEIRACFFENGWLPADK